MDYYPNGMDYSIIYAAIQLFPLILIPVKNEAFMVRI